MKKFNEFLRINAYAEAHYSGQSYNETVYLPIEYKEILESSDLTLYIHDLDGKHSEIEADISIEVITEEDFLADGDEGNDGERLDEQIQYLEGIDQDKLSLDMGEINEYLNSLDTKVSICFTIKKSQVDTVQEFIKKLKQSEKGV